MTSRSRPGYIIIVCMLLVSIQIPAQKVRAVVDTNTLSQNDVFTFKVVATDAEELPKVDIAPVLSDFTIVSGPAQQTNVQWVNGRKTSSRSLSWSLVPKASGEYIIPSLVVEVSNKKFSTNSVRITVTQSDPVFVSDDLIFKVDVDKKKVMVGEQITVEYTLYTRVNMSIQDLEFPEHTGFWTEELYMPKQIEFKDDQIDGVEYKSATLYRVALFPTQSGEYPLAPMTVHCQVAVQNQKGRRSIWDDPFFSNFTRQTVPKVLRTEETKISVDPFPEPQPNDFSGAVGKYSVSSNLESVNTKANEAVTLKIVVSGTGNIPLFSLPEIDFPHDLEVFPPSVTISKEP
ncbi:MAG: BatD family protein, partial [Candidatus Neomarinimicrobiota bacterium]